MIETPDLRLVAAEPELLRAALRGAEPFAAALGVGIPEGWYPEGLDHTLRLLEDDPSLGAWSMYLFLHPGERTLVGSGGFKGRPNAGGVVELGYEIAPAWRGRGLATQAAWAMAGFAFSHDPVSAVVAHTLPEANASTRVLQKIGMRHDGVGHDPEVGLVWRWRISRVDWFESQ